MQASLVKILTLGTSPTAYIYRPEHVAGITVYQMTGQASRVPGEPDEEDYCTVRVALVGGDVQTFSASQADIELFCSRLGLK